ncbi:hypothetical protein [Marinomonas shanghaiensis]|uniref:hypothetical protein n=1 Tax=Marinomonas shanghaiensis TaxID=2202418 RepID=UPI000DB938AE|nr:hypothetical protein [Marinomonas shanghaiensis]
MFENNMKHEAGLNKRYKQSMKGKWFKTIDRIRLRRNGATINIHRHKLNRKIRACYPRGKAFFKMVDLMILARDQA